MRKTLDKTLCELAKKNKKIWLLTADMGYKMFQDFPKDRFINVGIAEQNMIGIAAGLALSGKIVYCYSICNFLILRPYEFIRNDIAYQDLPVKLIGVGGKNEYPDMGISHNCPRDEDLKLIRILPNFVTTQPKTPQELIEVLKKSVSFPHPEYIRIGRK
jgi:transketolase